MAGTKKSPSSGAKKTSTKAAPKKKAAAKKAASKPAKKAASKASGSKTSKKKTSSKKAAAPDASATTTKSTATNSRATSSTKSSSATNAKAKKTASSSKSPAKSKLDKKFLDEQRDLLHEERQKYLKSADHLQAEADSLVEGREPGDVQFDEESGDGDSLAVERDRDLALSAQARQKVEEIDAALKLIEDGTYGICKISGKPIPKERLRAIPWATERVEEKVGGFRR